MGAAASRVEASCNLVRRDTNTHRAWFWQGVHAPEEILMCRDAFLPGGVPLSSGSQVILRFTLRASTQAQLANAGGNPLIFMLYAGNVCRVSVNRQISSLQQVSRTSAVSGICKGLDLGCVPVCRCPLRDWPWSCHM